MPEKGSGTSLPLPAPAPNGQAAPQAVPQLQPQAAAQASAPANNNDIARLFAGIKVSSGTVPAPAVAPGVPAPASFAAVQLLTPQLLQQEAASAAATAPAEVAPEAAAGTALLQSLLRGSGAASTAAAAAAPAVALPRPVDITGWSRQALPVLRYTVPFGHCALGIQVYTPPRYVPAEAADRALRSKVSSLLSSLASNEAFCGILAAELKKAGLV